MKHTLYILILMLLSIGTYAQQPPKHLDIATLLAYSDEIANNQGATANYFARIFAAPLVNGECWGNISSCPDIELLVSIHQGDYYEAPKLFRLPKAKGWKFLNWIDPKGNDKKGIGFRVKTILPEANIDQKERENWKTITYEVWVSMEAIYYTTE